MVTITNIINANNVLSKIVKKTPTERIERLSNDNTNIWFKREDLQIVRSYKLRGAYNKIYHLSDEEKERGVVCASAGNHAQGVAYSCYKNKIKATIFMPQTTPNQKIQRVKFFGKEFVEIVLEGNTYDEASKAAKEYTKKHNKIYVHPFDDEYVIAGQGTVGLEIINQLDVMPDYVFMPIGGGGLISGVSIALKSMNPNIKVIGVEPRGCPSMHESIKSQKIVELDQIDTFADGVAVKRVGENTFEIVKKYVDEIILVDEGHICKVMVDLYQNEGIVAEPAGAVSVAGFETMQDKLDGKDVVCVISGGNNDLLRYQEIMERKLVWEGRKRYFVVQFSQKPGQLRKFIDNVLGPNDDIVLFEYIKKNNKEKGPVLIGIEFDTKESAQMLDEKMLQAGFNFQEIKNTDLIYNLLI
ncbi:MAG: threonine ammonia-lyase IlvA [Candidatus Dojkabacteria bacterium]|nr:threonine ammonia-lyase IlvA [Candidatus Dojkabacteria bacterium]